MNDAAPSLRAQAMPALRWLLFVALPLLLGMLLVLEALDRVEQLQAAGDDERRRACLDLAIGRRTVGTEPARAFRFFHLSVRYARDDADDQAQIFANVMAAHGMSGTLRLQQEGRAAGRAAGNDPLPAFLGEVIEALALPAAAARRAARRLDPALRRLCGPAVTLARLRRRNGELLVVRTPRGPGLLEIERRSDGFGSAILCQRPPPAWVGELLAEHRRWVADEVHLGRAWPGLRRWEPPPGVRRDTLRLAWELAQRDPGLRAVVDGRSFVFDRDRWGDLTVWSEPLPPLSGVTRARRLVLAVGLALTLLSLAALRPLADEGGGGTLPIRLRLWLLFGYLAALPSLLALLLGWNALGDRRERLAHQAFQAGAQQLQSLVRSSQTSVEQFAARCRSIRHLPPALLNDRVRCEALLRRMRRTLDVDEFDLRDDRAQPVVTSQDPKVSFHFVQQSMCRWALRLYLPHRLREEDERRITPFDLLIDDTVANDELGWAYLLQYPGRSHELRMSRQAAAYWWDLLPESAPGGVTFVAFTNSRDRLFQQYLRQRLSTRSPGAFVQAIDSENGNPLPPLEGPDRRALDQLAALVLRNNQLLQRRVTLASGPAFVVALIEPSGQRWAVLAVRDSGSLLAQLQPFRAALLAGLLLALLVAAAAGRVLANLFLLPIADLAGGIEAIRSRQTGHRVPLRRPDEFGQLAAVFNHMLAELRELELARIVQTSLLPRRLPDVPGYSLAARNNTATDLGGDYYDLVRLPDGRLLALIGDATGHGVSAALAMAMARATVGNCLRDGETTTRGLLRALNTVFVRELKPQRKFMTLLLVILDPATHRYVFGNAGHNYPVLLRAATGTCEMADLPGAPLGFRLQSVFGETGDEMRPGDVLLLYTDGYTECETLDGEMVGHERLQAELARAAAGGGDAAAILADLLQALDAVRRPGPLADDVTLLVLRRCPI